MRRRCIVGAVTGSLLGLVAGPAVAANLTVKAQVSATHTVVGEPLQLTLTVEGDELQQARPAPLQLPPDWSSVAESQSQQVTWQQGRLHRRLETTYVLVPRSPGTFQLGPFTVERKGDTLQTEPLTIRVDPAAAPVPPTLNAPPGGRITL